MQGRRPARAASGRVEAARCATPRRPDDAWSRPRVTIVRMRRPRGHSLPELALVLAILGVVATLAMVRVGRLLDRAAVRAAAADVTALLASARDLAVAGSRLAGVRFDGARGVVTVRAGPDTLAHRALGTLHGVRLASSRDSILYSPLGTGWGAANARIVLTRGAAAETVTVSRMGRVRWGRE